MGNSDSMLGTAAGNGQLAAYSKQGELFPEILIPTKRLARSAKFHLTICGYIKEKTQRFAVLSCSGTQD